MGLGIKLKGGANIIVYTYEENHHQGTEKKRLQKLITFRTSAIKLKTG